MKILLKKSLQWVSVETECLFDNQYNTKDKRIMDADIIAVYDDVRVNKTKNRYNGDMVDKGQEQAYFDMMQERYNNKICKGCFWYQNRLINTTKKSFLNGAIETIRTEREYQKKCSYSDNEYEKRATCTILEAIRYDFNDFSSGLYVRHPKGRKLVEQTKQINELVEQLQELCLIDGFNVVICGYSTIGGIGFINDIIIRRNGYNKPKYEMSLKYDNSKKRLLKKYIPLMNQIRGYLKNNLVYPVDVLINKGIVNSPEGK